jgi:hypothetical protein
MNNNDNTCTVKNPSELERGKFYVSFDSNMPFLVATHPWAFNDSNSTIIKSYDGSFHSDLRRVVFPCRLASAVQVQAFLNAQANHKAEINKFYKENPEIVD